MLADADKVVTTWTSSFKRDPFEVPLETKIGLPDEAERNRAGGAGRHLRQLADPVRGRAEVLCLELKDRGSSQRLVRTYPQFSTTAADRATRRFPDARRWWIARKLVGYEYVEDYPWLARRRDAPATRSSRS